MSKASLRQASRLLQLVDEMGWTAEEVNKHIIEQWDLLRDVATASSANPVLKARIRALLPGVSISSTDPAVPASARGAPDKTGDLRIDQAQLLFHLGWGIEVNAESFKQYLESIPEIPEWPVEWKTRFSRLVLVDPRVDLMTACRLTNTRDETGGRLINHHTVPELPATPYWIRCQDGRRYRDHSALQSRVSFRKDEIGLVAIEGIALYVQDGAVLRGHSMDLPGSVLKGDPRRVAFLEFYGVRPKLHERSEDWKRRVVGSASRGIIRPHSE